jgi:PAS domain S-box-containing protein
MSCPRCQAQNDDGAQFCEGCGTRLALALNTVRLYEEAQQRLKQTETLLTVSQAIGSTLELTEIVRRATREMVRALGANTGGAWRLSPSGDQLIPLAGYHVPKALVEIYSGTPLPFGDQFIEEANRLEGPIYSSASQADPRFDHPLARLLPHTSVLIHPMWMKGEIIGAFAIVWVQETHRFTSEELRLVEAIARQVAVAIENARLYEAEREVREQLRISETRYRELFEKAADIVYLHDLEGKILAINDAGGRAGGYTREELLQMNVAQLIAPEDLARQTELLGRVIAGDRTLGFFTAQFIRKDGTRVVLECSGRLIVKDGVPVAIQGVGRDITVRRKLEERQAAFVEIARELASEDDFDRLFSLIGESVCQLAETDSAALSLVEGDEIVLRGCSRVDKLGSAAQRRKISESRVGRVVLTQQPHASSDMARDPHWKNSRVVTELGYRAVLEVPILLRGEVVGVLGAWHKSPRTFSTEDVALLVSLAGHVAVAFDRTKLVRELKAQLTETETLLTVSQAVGSTLDLTETMRRVARETCRALGADMAGAFLADPDQKYLRPIAGYHVPKHLLETFITLPIPLKGHLAVEEAWAHHRPVYSSDAEADPRLDRETMERFPQRSVLLAPMVAKGEPIGALFVTWWEQKHDFTAEELRLVAGISRQAALAIANAQLYREAGEVAERLRLLGQAVSSLGEVIVVTDLQGRVIFVNEAIKTVFGYEVREALGQYSRFLWAPSTAKGQMTAVMDAAAAGGWQGEVHGIKADGSEFPVALTAGPVRDESGQPVALVGIVRDLTREKALQVQLIQAEKLASIGQLAAGVAHEINNSLSIIIGFSSLALEKRMPKELADDLETIRAQGLRAAKIVQDLMGFAQPTPYERLPVDLNEVLRQTLSFRAYHLVTDQIEMVWKLTERLPETLADRGQLQQVILNLVLNAQQAMKAAQGHGTLWIETGTDGAQVWAKIRDDGPGIAPELLPKIFDPFLTTKPVGKGTGLGLSISYGIVEAHGGHLLAESKIGDGATFTIVLPVIERGVRAISEPPEAFPVTTWPLAVLVVDDEPLVTRFLSLMFGRLGHRAEVAHSGREALTMLARGSYDLMTLDLKMPHMSGQEVWQALQTADLPRRPKVIFITGDIVSTEARTFLAESGQPHLTKPFQPVDLSRKLSQLRFLGE